MPTLLKTLYAQLVETRKHELTDWRTNYQETVEEVQDLRARLQSGGALDEEDAPFLKKLLSAPTNGIANRGLSILSDNDFQAALKSEEFLSSLSAMIVTPELETWTSFGEMWKQVVGKSNPVLINRTLAACTLSVSTTVDTSKFDLVYSWLQEQGFVPTQEMDAPIDWFSRNAHLIGSLRGRFAAALEDGSTDEFWLNMFVWELYVHLTNHVTLYKQSIRYGAPGTGKTFLAKRQTEQYFDVWKSRCAPDSGFTYQDHCELVQFHPSFGYEDFIEGLRPVLDIQGQAQLSLQNGVFKEFCMRAGVWEQDLYKLGIEKNLDELTVGDIRKHQADLQAVYWNHIFACTVDTTRLSDVVPPFFFIIDEINRAELSRVLGELMYCLEYRGVQGRVKTQYANLNSETTAMLTTTQGHQFFIPTNVYVIGTMNTIDRSVESFDFAMRRRFRWEEIVPDIAFLKHHLGQQNSNWRVLAQDLKKLNDVIEREPLLGRDYCVGHAYLMNVPVPATADADELRNLVWRDRLQPLLYEYVRGSGRESEVINMCQSAFGL